MAGRKSSLWHGLCKTYSVGDYEMDVCDFSQLYECLGIPRRTHCLVFSLMAGDLPFASLIVVLDLLLER